MARGTRKAEDSIVGINGDQSDASFTSERGESGRNRARGGGIAELREEMCDRRSVVRDSGANSDHSLSRVRESWHPNARVNLRASQTKRAKRAVLSSLVRFNDCYVTRTMRSRKL